MYAAALAQKLHGEAPSAYVLRVARCTASTDDAGSWNGTRRAIPSFMNTIRRILVPVDFSECSLAAFDYAAEIGRRFEAEVDVLHVWEAPRFVPADVVVAAHANSLMELARTTAERDLASFVADATRRGKPVHDSRSESGYPFEVIVNAAKSGNYDLIVLGTHGRTGLARALIGSVAERVVRHAPCPVLTVRLPHPKAMS
jgi:nucleotide-binding universal stress UspA family protein